MSRNLPAQPNLDHLRNQAKDVLGDLERQNPDAKLADALHAVAREYGFSTWPNLKAHVESLPPQTDPFAGRWTANVSKSKQHPANQFRSATIAFAVSGDSVTISNVVVDASGRGERHRNTIHLDGKEYPSENGNGYSVLASRLGPRAFETVAKKDGEIVGRGTYEISADGNTLTIAAPEQVIVLDRRRN